MWDLMCVCGCVHMNPKSSNPIPSVLGPLPTAAFTEDPIQPPRTQRPSENLSLSRSLKRNPKQPPREDLLPSPSKGLNLNRSPKPPRPNPLCSPDRTCYICCRTLLPKPSPTPEEDLPKTPGPRGSHRVKAKPAQTPKRGADNKAQPKPPQKRLRTKSS